MSSAAGPRGPDSYYSRGAARGRNWRNWSRRPTRKAIWGVLPGDRLSICLLPQAWGSVLMLNSGGRKKDVRQWLLRMTVLRQEFPQRLCSVIQAACTRDSGLIKTLIRREWQLEMAVFVRSAENSPSTKTTKPLPNRSRLKFSKLWKWTKGW